MLPLPIFYFSEILIITPLKIKKGEITGTVFVNSRVLGIFLDLMKKINYPVRISRIENYSNSMKLTKKQRDILKAAVKYGYYDNPRRITQKELAEKLGISRSYLSESLRAIESVVFRNIGDKF